MNSQRCIRCAPFFFFPFSNRLVTRNIIWAYCISLIIDDMNSKRRRRRRKKQRWTNKSSQNWKYLQQNCMYSIHFVTRLLISHFALRNEERKKLIINAIRHLENEKKKRVYTGSGNNSNNRWRSPNRGWTTIWLGSLENIHKLLISNVKMIEYPVRPLASRPKRTFFERWMNYYLHSFIIMLNESEMMTTFQ